ncbi:MAG: NAD-dependent epimerase/dehydratase family protein [Candidatus Dormibacteria bacterium]
MRVFVAGGTGELGRATIPLLVAAGHAVRATARGPEKAATVRAMGAEPVEVDLFACDALRAAVRGHDVVARLTTRIPALAAMRMRSAWKENNRLRTEGARALVDAVLSEGVPRYISESVAFVYSPGGEQWLDEAAPVNDAGLDILAAAVTSEAEAARVSAAGGDGVVLRFGAFYSATSEQTRVMSGLARRKMFPVIGAGDNYVSSISVGDAGAAVTAALVVPGGTYNAVDDEPLRYRDYVQAYVDAVAGPAPLTVPLRVGRAALGGNVAEYLLRSLRVSNRRLRLAGQWAPADRSLREGLAAIATRLTPS